MTNGLRDRLRNIWWETRLHIATRGTEPAEHPDAVHYATMGYRTIRAILDHLGLEATDVFVDIGCGKGRVLCCAARHRVKQVIGVEMSTQLCRRARHNARQLRGQRAPIEVSNTLAGDFDYSPATVLFLFDPFGKATLAPLLARIGRETGDHPVRIAYANPTHHAVFENEPWLQLDAFWHRAETGLEHDVAYYRTREPDQ